MSRYFYSIFEFQLGTNLLIFRRRYGILTIVIVLYTTLHQFYTNPSVGTLVYINK